MRAIPLGIATIAAMVSLSAFAGEATRSFICKSYYGEGTPSSTALVLKLRGKQIVDLTVEDYWIVKNSEVRDQQIGDQVFNVQVSKVTQRDKTLALNASLQDYSEDHRWEVRIASDSGEGALISHYESSDGDNAHHITATQMICK